MFLSALAAASIILCLLLVLTGRRMETSRAIRIHVPVELVWEGVRDFGSLHASHARGRPMLRIDASTLLEGDGRTPRSIWIQRGHWGDQPYWAEIELTSFDAPRRLAVRLRRDSLGTERGLRRHRCEIHLAGVNGRETRVVLAMGARFRGLRLPLLSRVAPERLRSRLLDLAMRSVKHTLGAIEVTAPGTERTTGEATAPVAGTAAPEDDLAPPPPFPAPPMGDRI